EILRIVAAAGLPVMPDLQQKLSGFRKLQDVRILLVVAANPYVVFVIDEHAVLVVRPLVTGARTAPALNEISGGIKLDHRRSGNTAIALRRRQGRVLVVVVESPRTACNPDVVMGVYKNTADLPEHPVIRQLLRPVRIGLKLRHTLRRSRKCKDRNGSGDFHA